MRNKVCLVTGATAGIGEVTACALAEKGATVIVVGRNSEKCERTIRDIKHKTGNEHVEYLLADLSVQKQTRELASQFKKKYQRLDVLVNNAGGIYTSRQLSEDGIEMTFALNHLAYFLLTNLLLDTLKESPSARIINVSSMAHIGGKIDFEDVQGNKWYTGWGAYGQSKLSNVLFTYELARRTEGTKITANALHPGVVATEFGKNNGFFGTVMRGAMDLFSISPEEGAETTIYLASSSEVEGITGKYFNKKKPVQSSDASYDLKTAKRLWEISEEMTRKNT
ncbi:MAG: SDR family oxidoreductase [Chlorobiales bacterium]|nr:SDR family oxidoreductase [Chlorobiales bacterium]